MDVEQLSYRVSVLPGPVISLLVYLAAGETVQYVSAADM